MALLLCYCDPVTGRSRARLMDRPFRVGRGLAQPDISIESPAVDRIHAELICSTTGPPVVRRLSQDGALFVNDVLADSATLGHGDEIHIGEVPFQIRAWAPQSAAAAGAASRPGSGHPAVTPTHTRELLSEAPLVSQAVRLESGEVGLMRSLHQAWLSDASARALLQAEIDAAARVPPGCQTLVPLLAADTGQEPYLLRELSRYGTLADRLGTGPPLTGGELLTAVSATLTALDQLWRLGLVHGDPAPHNLLLQANGTVKLTDMVSARRRFAVMVRGAVVSEGRELDVDRFSSWFVASARSSSQHGADPVLSALLACTDDKLSRDMRLAALWQVVAQHGKHQAPLRLSSKQQKGDQAVTLPAPIAVALCLGPITDSRICYWVAKRLAPILGQEAAELRVRLAAREIKVLSQLPQPARSLASELQQAGCQPVIRRRPDQAEVAQEPVATPRTTQSGARRKPADKLFSQLTEQYVTASRKTGEAYGGFRDQLDRSGGLSIAVVGELLISFFLMAPAFRKLAAAVKELFHESVSRETVRTVLTQSLLLYGRLIIIHLFLLLAYAVPLNLIFR
jgi:hypothetical protein